MISCANGTPPSPSAHRRAEGQPAAEDAPVDRPPLGRFGLDQEDADDRYRRHHQRHQEHRLARQHEARARPDSPATARMPADSARRPSTCTMPRSARTSGVRPRLAVRIDARDHLRRHGVRDHVLDHGAEHDQHRAQHVELVRRQKREPFAGGAGERDQPGRGAERADQDVGRAAASRGSGRNRPARRTPSSRSTATSARRRCRRVPRGLSVRLSLIQKSRVTSISPSAP